MRYKLDSPSATVEWLGVTCLPTFKRLLRNPDTFEEVNSLINELLAFRKGQPE